LLSLALFLAARLAIYHLASSARFTLSRFRLTMLTVTGARRTFFGAMRLE